MKIKKSYIVLGVVALLLIVFIVMGVTKPDPHAGHNHGATQSTVDPHAGHNHATTTVDPHAGHNHATTTKAPSATANKDLTPTKSYTCTEKDGVYTVAVTARNGKTVFSEEMHTKPTFIEVNQDTLEIARRTSKDLSLHWAVYVDIETGRVSRSYTKVLASFESRVSYIDQLSDKWQVLVTDIFDQNTSPKAYALEGMAFEGSYPNITYTQKGPNVTVTYPVKGGTKTLEINLLQK